ncbi:hypothetical protein GOBAR_AA13334 [Gossypium barbadense]|uniref:Phorbol-ester/DAG-type domain-containing protein n=2 Tax=Gossypium barbadense TaxID=3634 RepID=A0A2P5XVD8_GOSBA|nr:hypothetical protein GOBAR_AA13334 [Gossypium barbadense]
MEMDNENESHHKSVQQIQHPFHKEHPLVLLTEQSDEALKAYCDGCGELLSAPCFTCIHCNYHLHKQCAEAPLSLPNHPLHPKHSSSGLFLQKRPHYDNDLKCTSLPRIIKFSRHDHCIFHKYFLQTQELTKQDCKICFKEVKLDRGSYSCGKTGCNYVVHVNCVLEDDRLYEVIEEEKQCEELYEKSIQSSITHVIETHWFRQWQATHNFEGFKQCEFCAQYCSGFFYNIGGAWDMCIRCAKVADIIKCEGHQHFLFYDFKCNEKCNGCGTNNDIGAFRCGKCKFTLGFGCLTLPHSALHKIDQHMLNLTYHDDREQSYCDICEQEKDPRLWYYSCSNCDTSAHTECVLGQFPFLKDGSTFSHYGHKHRHDLEFFRKAEGYPRCSYCGKLCQEEILKCKKSTCNYIVHCKCRNYQV